MKANIKIAKKSKPKEKVLVYELQTDCYRDFLNFCNAMPFKRENFYFAVLETKVHWIDKNVISRITYKIATSLDEKLLHQIVDGILDGQVMADTLKCVGSLKAYTKNLT